LRREGRQGYAVAAPGVGDGRWQLRPLVVAGESAGKTWLGRGMREEEASWLWTKNNAGKELPFNRDTVSRVHFDQ
jgi:hypothetical protein